MRILLLLCCLLAPPAAEIPPWLPAGILQVETGSLYDAAKRLHYVQKGGPDVGPFQVGRISVERLKQRGKLTAGFSATVMETNMKEAERVARLLMVDLYENEAKGDWFVVASMWKHGPTGYRQNRSVARQRGERIRNIGQRMVSEGKYK